MKILVIIHEFPPIGGGGGPIARDLTAEWVRRGHQVRVVTAHLGNLPKREFVDGVEVIRLKSERKEAFRAKMGAMVGFVAAAARYCLFECNDFHPDIIHVHFAVPCGPIAMAASKKMKVPYVITAHLGDIPGASPEKTGKWFKYIFPLTPPIWKHAARVIAVSNYSKTKALESYSVPIDVVPNGIDYNALRNQNISAHRIPEIVFAGRFVPQKNLSRIVKTLSCLKDKVWHCTLIGDGQERASIEALIEEEHLSDRFILTGWKKPEEVVEIFRKSDILFMPSLNEGLPVTGIQAMASGLALVLSNAGGNPEIVIPGKNGMIHDPNDTEGFVSDIAALLDDPEHLLQMRRSSVELASHYDMKNTASDYLKIFKEVLE